MKLLLGLDLETSGVDPKTCNILEVGAVLYDFDSHQPVQIMDEFISGEVSPDISALTGILQEHVDLFGHPLKTVYPALCKMVDLSIGVIAHNGLAFDKPILDRAVAAIGEYLPERPWIDSMIDLPYPATCTSYKLNHLAADHGIMNPFSHRAFSDVLTTLAIAEKYDIDKALELARSPVVIVRAHVDYGNRELASSQRFHWNAQAKIWEKSMRRAAWAELKGGWKFESSIVG